MKTIHHQEPANGKPTYLKVRFTVLDDPPRLTFEVLEQDEKLRNRANISIAVRSVAYPAITEDSGVLQRVFLRGDCRASDGLVHVERFSSVASRDACLAQAQQALIEAEPRIIDVCEGRKK